MKATLSSSDLRLSTIAMQNLLRSSQRKWQVLNRFRTELDASNFDQALRMLRSDARWRERELHTPFPSDVSLLDPGLPFTQMDLKREIQWSRAYLRPYASELNTFVGFANSFIAGLVSGRVNQAKDALEAIESEFGQSLWLIKAKIHYTQISSGLEQQKRLTASLLEQTRQGAIVPAIIHYVSQRNEPSVTSAGLRGRVERLLAASNVNDTLRSYFRYHVVPVPGAVGDRPECVLCYESYGTVIDYYVAMVHSLPAAMDTPDARGAALKAVRSLKEIQSSRRLQFINNWLVSDYPLKVDTRFSELFESFFRGEYGLAADRAERLIELDPINADAYEYLARAKAIVSALPSVGISAGARLIANLQSLLSGGEDIERASDELEKTLFNWAGSPFTAMIARLLAKYARPDLVAGMTMSAQRATYAHPSFCPDRLADIDNDHDRQKYAQRIAEKSSSALVTNYALSVANRARAERGLADLAHERGLVLDASIARSLGDFAGYENSALQLIKSSSRFYRQLGIRWAADVLLHERKIAALVSLIADSVVADFSVRPFMPIRDALINLSRTDRRELRGSTSLSIVLDLYSRHEGTEHDDLRAITCEAFFRSKGVDRPSHLKVEDDHQKAKMIYFLRFVCTEEVLDNSQCFNTSQAVAEERLAICRSLRVLDSANKAEYESEIREVLRRLVIKRRMREIDESKISMDNSRVRSNLPEAVSEASNRYLAYLKSGINRDIRRLIENALAEQKGPKTSSYRIIVPSDGSLDTLRTAIEGVRDEYVSSTEYGLDGVLSMNIRHGALAAQLRNPLELAHLITKRNATNKEYYPNDRWVSRVENPSNGARINRLLTTLAERFDSLIEEVLGSWIRVRKTTNDAGLFDFVISEQDVALLDAQLQDTAEPDELLGVVFVFLTDRLSWCLREVREKLENDAKTKALTYLSELETELEKISEPIVAEIRSAINNGRTNLQHSFERVERWIQLSQGSKSEPFFLEDAIHLSAASVRLLDPRFKVQLHTEETDTLQFDGRFLASLFYIFHNAFENIVKHSHSTDVTGNVKVESDGLNAHVSIISEVSAAESGGIRRGVAEATAKLQRESPSSLVAAEGGTGLLKIRAILLRDFSTERSLNITFIEPNSVKLEFSLRLDVGK